MNRGAWLALALLAVGCDEGPKHLKVALARHQALVDARTPPSDPGFDEVLAELAKVPADSRAHPEAVKLAEAIRHVRSMNTPRPLARAPLATDEVLHAIEVKCSSLARQVGEAQGEARDALAQELKKCEAARAARDDHLAHSDLEPAHDGGTEGHAPVGAANARDAGRD